MEQDLVDFLIFLRRYLRLKVLDFSRRFEKIKDLIVAFLIVKRGKYSQSFLNTSFFLLIATAIISGPIIAENNPFVLGMTANTKDYPPGVLSYNPYENSLITVISVKPRDKIVDYQVVSGDTLSSIAKKFDISVDTIKWANDLKTEVIKPGQILKIPPVTGVVHRVSSGENIYTIAKKYKTDPQKIVNFPFNDFLDLETFTLAVGQILYVPDGVIEPEKPKVLPPKFVAQIQAGVRGTSNFIWPTSGSITQEPVWYHMAVDIANPSQPAILAADSGVVTFAGCVGWGYGCHIVINHGNGFETLYAHLSQPSVVSGQNVSQGEKIGIMGCTGRCTGSHLHFEIRSGGILVNPLNFLR